MITGLKPYPALKDSGVPWLGDVPEHWEVLPALAAFRPKEVRNTGMVEKTVLSLSYGRIVVRPPDKLHGLVPESFETYQIVDPGNIIVRSTDMQNDQTSLRIGQSEHRGIITSAYMCLETTNRVANKFGYQFLNAYDMLKIIYGFGSGLRQNLDFRDVKRMPVLIPPLREQDAIGQFLDYADRRIGRYVRAKRKLIKLLEDQEQAIIHQAVTRGLDPDVHLKPSDVDWLGDIPEHWEVRRLKTLCSMRSGDSITTMSIETAGDYPVYGGNGVRGYTSNYTHNGDFALIGRQGALCGNIHIAHGRFWASEHAVVVNLRPGYVLDWFGAALGAMNLNQYSIAAAQPGLAVERLLNLSVPIPPAQEQGRIATYIDNGTVDLVKAVESAKREIDLIREYRTRLIADVVTGKVDVRVVEAALSEEADEPEPPEDEVEVDGTVAELDGEDSGGEVETARP